VSVDTITASVGGFSGTTWTLGALAPGASETLTVVLTVGSAASIGTDVISNTATLTGVTETGSVIWMSRSPLPGAADWMLPQSTVMS
jgi:hypothetical protein